VPFRDQDRFCDTGSGQHIRNNGCCGFSRDVQVFRDAPVKPALPFSSGTRV
jgi:hypothetical protein